jgi:hypothetical protein
VEGHDAGKHAWVISLISKNQQKDTGIEDNTVLYLPDDGKNDLQNKDVINDLILVYLSGDKKTGWLELDQEGDYKWTYDRHLDLTTGRAKLWRTS